MKDKERNSSSLKKNKVTENCNSVLISCNSWECQVPSGLYLKTLRKQINKLPGAKGSPLPPYLPSSLVGGVSKTFSIAHNSFSQKFKTGSKECFSLL